MAARGPRMMLMLKKPILAEPPSWFGQMGHRGTPPFQPSRGARPWAELSCPDKLCIPPLLALQGLEASLEVSSVRHQSLAWPQGLCPHACPALYSHLRHDLRQVGRDGSEAFATTVHDAIAARAHGRAGAGGEGARGHAPRLPLACRNSGL